MTKTVNHATSVDDKPTIVFIHGWGLNHSVWLPVAEKLQTQFRVNLIDLPGFGDNSAVEMDEYSIEKVAAYVAAHIDQQAIVVGWSLGGLVATYLALHFPEKVKQLITVASSPYFVEQENWPGIDAKVLTSFHQQLSSDSEKTITNFLKIQAMGSPSLRNDIKQLTQLVMSKPQPSQTTLDQSLYLLDNIDLRQQLQTINQPFLRIYGSSDALVPKTCHEKVSLLAPNSEGLIISGASHAPFISHREEFLSHLLQWVDAQGNIDN